MVAVTFVQGGFAEVGGIETFASDLLLALYGLDLKAELVCWDSATIGGNGLLDVLEHSGIQVHRSAWRWGCRWGWPDRLMAFEYKKQIRDANLLVFGKLLHPSVHERLRSLGKRMMFITPYRPSEMWSGRHSDSLLLNSFEKIIVQAPSFETDLRELGYQGEVVLLPYIPPEVQAASSWPAYPPLRIGFLGRFVPDKNLDYLFQSFRILRESGVAAELHLFGDGPERERLVRFAADLQVAEYVVFHGVQSRARIQAAIDTCHIFAFSSRTEGQCLAALEILARGRPIVATPVGAFPEILRDARLGAMSPLNEPEAFAHVLKDVGSHVAEGVSTPSTVQEVYRQRFPRRQVIDQYVLAFGCNAQSRKMVPEL